MVVSSNKNDHMVVVLWKTKLKNDDIAPRLLEFFWIEETKTEQLHEYKTITVVKELSFITQQHAVTKK